MSKHTPTPWAVDTDGGGVENKVITSPGADPVRGMDDDVCEVYGGNDDDPETRRANANLIVRAVNNHAALVAALEILLVQCGEYKDGDGAAKYHAVNIAREALAAAKEEK